MRRSEEFILRRVAGMTVIVPVGQAAEQFPGMISVNDTGALLWEYLEEERTADDLVEELTRQFEVTPEAARADVDAFLEKLNRAGAVRNR